MKPRVLLAWLATLVLAASSAIAAVPETVSYQGVLTDGSGAPVADGSYPIRFRLYEGDGSTVVWEETQSVAVAGGRFSVLLGAVVSLGAVAFDEPYLLGIKVGADPELAPLTPLASAPYAFAARSLILPATVRYLSVSAEEFTPGSSTTSFTRNTLRVYSNTNNSAMGCGIHLPHGARLLELRVLFNDIEATREVTLALRRTNTTTGSFEQLGAVTSGLAFSGGLTSASTSFFTSEVVDNQNWAYSLQAFWTTAAGSNLAIATVLITYSVTQPLP